ncbi:LysR family transcriptional regulator [Agrobacterium larrymoorei]|uniref:LysR family transcriptional regulator n=1 Tax=Agrobacterium larrymoorei TaxID=160699 RepID=A0A4D7E027_9HYPH|nr:LysR family transcriptional regulator [Agrobacterium larrymoorei]QCJ00705.1 LysR family transcriptional regulator [Agrobacterium larrymoorei]QYA10706.1 LysR family transcriptional regulator [Agrobacterium larrymoorei]
MDLLALADFTLVARYGGFGKAARIAGRPKATLSRRVADLEASLDLRLFERGARDLKLTEEGRALFERTAQLLTELEETTTSIASRSQTPRGRLRISAPLLFAQAALGKLAAGFLLKYPEMRIEIVVEDRPVDMIEEAYDLVIRVNPKPDVSLVGRAFLHDRQVVVAAPKLVWPEEGRAMPSIVRGSVGERNNWKLKTAKGPMELNVIAVLGMSSNTMLRDAVLMGAGVARLPLSLVTKDIASGRLNHWGDIEGAETALWALYPSRRLLSARVSAFLDYLKEAFPQGSPEELAAYLN